MGMAVDLNNLRKQAVYSYGSLCKKLNNAIEAGGIWSDRLVIDVDDIQSDMDDLRMHLVTLACCYLPDDDDFKEVIDEVGEIAAFNEEEEPVTTG